MKNNRDMDRLTDTLFEAENDKAFRESMLQLTVQTSRTRRRNRALAQGALVTTMVLVAGLAISRQRQPAQMALSATSSNLRVVESRPLAPGTVIRSRATAFSPAASLSTSLVTVHTTDQKVPVAEVGDEQLLALLHGQALGLIREPGQPAALMLASAPGASDPAIR